MRWLAALSVPALCSFAIARDLPQCPFGSYGPPPGGGASYGGPADTAPPAAGGTTGPSPTAPTAPTPSGPTTGGGAPAAAPPAGPTTGGGAPAANPSGPTTGGGAPGAGRGGAGLPGKTGSRGVPMAFTRGATSKQRLKVEWLHPVPAGDVGQGTAATGPLPLAEALRVLWEDDDRPLLVLRECKFCRGSDAALFDGSMQNDRAALLTKWFRVVRLPAAVSEASHPFYNVFAAYPTEGSPAHFFLLAHPDAQPVQFTGMQTPSSLWRGMTSVLQQRYGKDPQKAVKQWVALLDQFDRVDAAIAARQAELYETRADEGPTSSKARRLEQRLDDLRQERDALIADEARVRDLHLLSTGKPSEATATK